MGYYDEDYQSNTQTQAKQEKSGRTWLTTLASSIIGGLIVVFMIPGLAQLNVLPYDIVPKQQNQDVTAPSTSTAAGNVQSEVVQVSVQSDVIDAVEKVSDSIVGVVNIQERNMFFSRQIENVESGTGSGVIFDIVGDKAHIVTNYHVIQNANRVEISLSNGERVEARLVGADSLTDLAVLEIDATHVSTVAEFGDSDTLRPGEPAMAIGNPLGLEFSRTVTQGIISAKDRSITVENGWEINVIQTDAAINPGNSGGALINIKGQVVGINSLKVARSGVEGLGFAIPINDALPIIKDLVEHGEVLRPQLGIKLRDLASIDSYHLTNTLKLPSDIRQGVLVEEVISLSPANRAGLKSLDVIVEINGEKINNSIELRRYLFTKTSIGETIEVKAYRDGLPLTFEVTLEKASTEG